MPRPCVRTVPSRCEFPSGRPLPSARLVAFGGVIGTMSRSDSRPRLDGALRFALVPHPGRRPSRRSRSGLLGPHDDPSCVRRPATPVERHRLASRRRTSCLRLREQPRPPPPSSFPGSLPAPHTTPVYASNLTSPPGPQDSVPTCPLRRWSDGTPTRRSSSVSPAHSRLMWKLSGPSSGPPSYKSFVNPLFPAFAFSDQDRVAAALGRERQEQRGHASCLAASISCRRPSSRPEPWTPISPSTSSGP